MHHDRRAGLDDRRDRLRVPVNTPRLSNTDYLVGGLAGLGCTGWLVFTGHVPGSFFETYVVAFLGMGAALAPPPRP